MIVASSQREAALFRGGGASGRPLERIIDAPLVKVGCLVCHHSASAARCDSKHRASNFGLRTVVLELGEVVPTPKKKRERKLIKISQNSSPGHCAQYRRRMACICGPIVPSSAEFPMLDAPIDALFVSFIFLGWMFVSQNARQRKGHTPDGSPFTGSRDEHGN